VALEIGAETELEPNHELRAHGLANLASALVGGIPASPFFVSTGISPRWPRSFSGLTGENAKALQAANVLDEEQSLCLSGLLPGLLSQLSRKLCMAADAACITTGDAACRRTT